MLQPRIEAFVDELYKIAAKKPPAALRRADAFHDSEDKNWGKFEKDLKNKPFQQAMLKHEQTDPKLKKYVKNYGGQLLSKAVLSIAPSRTTPNKEYKVKVLPTGRLTCECRDWQYRHSVRKTDCAHIKAVRAMFRSGLIPPAPEAKK